LLSQCTKILKTRRTLIFRSKHIHVCPKLTNNKELFNYNPSNESICARPQYGLKLYPVVLDVVNVFSYISLLVRATDSLENKC
jgi:hypothetical protein